MEQKYIDLRSDTVTKPTPAMREAMFSARVGDDVMGEDETVSALEEKSARLFGMEAALFCPSGTMTNQIAIKCFTQPLDEVIADQTAHVYRYEGGGIAFNSAASVRLLYGERGLLTPELISPEINADDIHFPRTSLVVLENTVNRGGGSCYTIEQIKPIADLCRRKQLKLHLDGARLFNALIATGDKTEAYGKLFDGISICLSKGLGAPVGSVLLGTQETIRYARRVRKALGGGMRQAGFLAAAGMYALDHHVDRLREDHDHARTLALALEKCSWVSAVLPVETNIVLFDTLPPAEAVVKIMGENSIRCNSTGPNRIRFVTHLDVSAEMIGRAVKIIGEISL